MIRILGTIFAGLLGLAFGSFLNVCLSRWPQGESVIHPRSHCRTCGHTLPWWENLPLVSWLALRGHCSNCRTWIGWRYPLVEFALGALWASLAWQLLAGPRDPGLTIADYCFGLQFAAGRAIFYWLILALAVFDAENLWLPDVLTLPGIALGFAFTIVNLVFLANQGTDAFEDEKYGAFGAATHRLLGILAAAGFILIIRWIYWLIRRHEGMGLGDAKLMAMLAAWLGFKAALLSFGLAIVLGAAIALLLLVAPNRRSQKSWALKKLPLGTFLCIGGIISSFWGPPMIAAYLRWSGF